MLFLFYIHDWKNYFFNNNVGDAMQNIVILLLKYLILLKKISLT